MRRACSSCGADRDAHEAAAPCRSRRQVAHEHAAPRERRAHVGPRGRAPRSASRKFVVRRERPRPRARPGRRELSACRRARRRAACGDVAGVVERGHGGGLRRAAHVEAAGARASNSAAPLGARDRVADAQARERVHLREGAQETSGRSGARGPSSVRGYVGVVDVLVVGLVADHDDARAARASRKRAPRGASHDRAGGIVRVADDDEPRARRDRGEHRLEVVREAARRARRRRARRPARRRDAVHDERRARRRRPRRLGRRTGGRGSSISSFEPLPSATCSGATPCARGEASRAARGRPRRDSGGAAAAARAIASSARGEGPSAILVREQADARAIRAPLEFLERSARHVAGARPRAPGRTSVERGRTSSAGYFFAAGAPRCGALRDGLRLRGLLRRVAAATRFAPARRASPRPRGPAHGRVFAATARCGAASRPAARPRTARQVDELVEQRARARRRAP